jgi:hypothetical protein
LGYCFVIKSYSFSLRFGVIHLFLQELRALNLEELKNFSVFQTFFHIFADIGLKLGLLLCNKELQIQFAFRCDSQIFARVTCLELTRIEEFFSFQSP